MPWARFGRLSKRVRKVLRSLGNPLPADGKVFAQGRRMENGGAASHPPFPYRNATRFTRSKLPLKQPAQILFTRISVAVILPFFLSNVMVASSPFLRSLRVPSLSPMSTLHLAAAWKV